MNERSLRKKNYWNYIDCTQNIYMMVVKEKNEVNEKKRCLVSVWMNEWEKEVSNRIEQTNKNQSFFFWSNRMMVIIHLDLVVAVVVVMLTRKKNGAQMLLWPSLWNECCIYIYENYDSIHMSYVQQVCVLCCVVYVMLCV